MFVHRSNRMEELVAALAEVVRRPAGSALEPEVVVVQSKGMERWIGLELCKRLGVWANARFPFPRALVEELLSAADPARASAEAFSRDALTWSIARLLPELAMRAEARPVASYLADDPHGLKRFLLAERIANAFDQYAVYRPELVLSWEGGAPGGWQAELWRALVARHGPGHVAARARRFFDAWAAPGALPVNLPRRISVFGVSALPPLYVQVLGAAAQRMEIHLFQLSPSREYWAEVRSRKEALRARARAGAFDGDDAEPGDDTRLLGSLGRAGRDFQRVLEAHVDYVEDGRDLYRDPGADSLLHALQSDILALRAADGKESERRAVAVGDASLGVVSCHGPMREVEILRDQLLALFDADPTLEPRDVVVMTPDIDAYAPLVDAVFGLSPWEAGYVPYRIADRSLRAASPVAEAFLAALALMQGRMKASEVLDLLQLAPVRERFGIDADEVEELGRWVHACGVRWGIDARDRAAHGQPALAENTWRFGFERLLLGYAMPRRGSTLFEGRLPQEDVEGGAADAVGRLIELGERLFTWKERLAAPRTLGAWQAVLGELLEDLLATPEREAYQLAQLRDALAELASRAGAADFEEPVHLELVCELLARRFESERSAHDFLAGGVTFCAMLPMRSIPFRVVVLLGMNDDGFPRKSTAPDFDLVQASPRLGDRSLGDEDRYLFLEALLSARERFIVSYVGRGIRDNEVRPPSVVLGELLDAVADGFQGAPAVVEHPLQPFSPRYFDGADPRLFSYASAEAGGARELVSGGHAEAPFQRAALPDAGSGPVDVDALARFFENPAKALLVERLGLYLSDEPMLVEDREPMEVDALEHWRIGDDLFRPALDGQALPALLEASRASGVLPLGVPGKLFFDRLAGEVAAVAGAARRWIEGERLETLVLDFPVEGERVIGTLAGVWPSAQVRAQFSRLKPKNEVSMWVRHLALACVAPAGHPRRSVVVGRALEGGAVAERVFRAVPAAEARSLLAQLIRIYRLGQRAPVPLFPASARAYMGELAKGEDAALDAARERFAPPDPSRKYPESEEAYVAQLFRGADPLDPAFRAVPDLDVPSFGELSRLVFGPLLASLEEPDA